jgi:LEA14-like dessication related protein
MVSIPHSAFENGGSTMNKRLALITVLLFGLGVLLASCASVQVKPTEENFKDPVIRLESFEVPQYDGYAYYGNKVKPTKGKADNRGTFLTLSFVFNIENPNPYPILLEEIKYSVAFDNDFIMITTADQVENWIPPGTTDQVRVTTLITTRSALLGLLLANAVTLKDKGWDMWDTIEKWWTGVPDQTVPVSVTEGAFAFSANGVYKVIPYMATIPAM